MPLVSVMRYKIPGVTVAGVGTQDMSGGTLTLTGTVTVKFDPTLFNTTDYPVYPVTFTIFSGYSSLSGSIANLTYDLTGTGFNTCVFADTGSTITATLSV